MVPSKSERFEMRLEEDVLDRVDDWRRGHDKIPSRSEAIRRLIEVGLTKKQTREIEFSDGEKLILLMLADMSRGKKMRGEFDPDFIEDTILGGHLWGFRWKYNGLFHDHKDDGQVVSEVVDILDMWSFLESGFQKLSPVEKEKVKSEAPWASHGVSFLGFDGNYEADHLSIMGYLIEKLDRFQSFKLRGHLNSHFPTLTRYRLMLSVFLPIRATLSGGELAASSIIKILSAPGLKT